MRWQRWARLAVAAVGIGCAAAIYFSTRERPVASPLTTTNVDQQATQQGGKGSYFRSLGDKEKGRIEYESFAAYPDGRKRFLTAHMISSEDDGLEIWADTVETKGTSAQPDNPDNVDLNGHVRILLSDGLEVRTESANYDERASLLRIPGALTFSKGAMSGSGVGAFYDRGHESLQIDDQAHVERAAGADRTGAMSATSKSLTFTRIDKRLQLGQNAQIVQNGDALAGDIATLLLTDDEKYLKLIELRGHATVTPGTAAGARPPTMRGDEIDLGFYPGGEILQRTKLVGHATPATMVLVDAAGRRSITGPRIEADMAPDGATLTRLDSAGPMSVQLPAGPDVPAREIRATELTSRGAEKTGLTSAKFLGNVEFIESPRATPGPPGATPPAVRRVTSRSLELRVKGQLDAIDTATFQENVVFRDGEHSGSAERMIYDAAKETLLLRPMVRPSPKLAQTVGDELTVNAQEIDLDLKKNDLHARQDVKTNTQPKAAAGPAKATKGIFDDHQPMFGAASELHIVNKVATYVGLGETRASLTQGDSEVQGAEVKLFTETNNLTADGRVRARFMLTTEASGAGPDRTPAKNSRYDLTADSMTYDDAKRTATFIGKPATMTRPEGTTDATQIVIELAAESRSVQQFIASGAVYSEEGKRSAAGDRLVYDARTEHYVLTGKMAKVKMPNTEVVTDVKADGCVITEGTTLQFERQGRPAGYTQSKKAGCDFPIR